jgi:membrane protein implicated in regulation of membrane protease activity
MDDITWILWAVLGVILIIAEMFTLGFVLLWFGIGALASSVAAILGFGYPLQFLIFFVVSSALTIASRTLFMNYLSTKRKGTDIKFGMEALPGKVGTVVSSSQGALKEAAVKVHGSIWTAFPTEGETTLEIGDKVIVERIEGASLYVRHANSLPPDWRRAELPEKNQ